MEISGSGLGLGSLSPPSNDDYLTQGEVERDVDYGESGSEIDSELKSPGGDWLPIEDNQNSDRRSEAKDGHDGST